MKDKQLGTMEWYIDAWLGEIPFQFSCSVTESVRFRIRAGESSPSTEQRRLIEEIAKRYELLWPKIRAKLTELGSDAEEDNLSSLPKPRLLLSVPGVINTDVVDFLLGYEFED
jgi:hypothetical protein